jgi:hypothetical protein
MCGLEYPKPSTQTRAAKPNSSRGKKMKASKQHNQQKRVACEHGDRMDQFAPAPATR